MLLNLKKRRILNKTERGILNPRTAEAQEPGYAARVQHEAVDAFSDLLDRDLGSSTPAAWGRPWPDAKQVAGHVFDTNQNSAFLEVHRHPGARVPMARRPSCNPTFTTGDSEWAAQGTTHTVSRLRARIPPVQDLP